MKALTLTQPWAMLIALHQKRVETRSWGTSYRGPIAIHAAKGLSPIGGRRGLREICMQPAFASALGKYHWPNELTFGAILARARLVNVKRINMDLRARILSQSITPNEIEFGDYTTGRYAWFLEDVEELVRPIYCNGAYSLWEAPPLIDTAAVKENHNVARDNLSVQVEEDECVQRALFRSSDIQT